MAERQSIDQHPLDQHMNSPPPPPPREDMIACVMALEAALLPCLPARELQAIDRSPHPSHQIDVERHARDFMEAAKKLQLYFIGLQREDQPTKAEALQKEIAVIEEELKIKTELIKKQETLIQGWRKELKDQLETHNVELDRVEEEKKMWKKRKRRSREREEKKEERERRKRGRRKILTVEGICYCGNAIAIRTSWTDSNPGRRFYSCSSCGYLVWKDPPMRPRSRTLFSVCFDGFGLSRLMWVEIGE